MNTPQDPRPPIAQAMEWASRISAIGLEILVCIWLGSWLDKKLDTTYWSVVGVIVGPAMGFWHLLLLTGAIGKQPPSQAEEAGSDLEKNSEP